tara:strand:- start:19721 stop:20413 length:693 start_codon:yes stop_codon:yes gene_type:complete
MNDKTGTAVMTLEERQAQMVARQAEASQGLRTTGSYISFKNANMKVDGQSVPNNTAEVRVLAAIGERTYYAGAFDPDAVQVPTCYALDSHSPHHEAKEQQADTCGECKWNKWGTAVDSRGNPARGKACREGARIIVVPANVALKTAPMYTAKIPVTSLGAVTAFTDRCNGAGAMFGEMVTTLSCTEDKKSFFKVHLTIKERSTDIDRRMLMDKTDEAMELAMTPYPNLEE